MNKPVCVSLTGKIVYNSARAEAMRAPKPLHISKKDMQAYTSAWEIDSITRIDFYTR